MESRGGRWSRNHRYPVRFQSGHHGVAQSGGVGQRSLCDLGGCSGGFAGQQKHGANPGWCFVIVHLRNSRRSAGHSRRLGEVQWLDTEGLEQFRPGQSGSDGRGSVVEREQRPDLGHYAGGHRSRGRIADLHCGEPAGQRDVGGHGSEPGLHFEDGVLWFRQLHLQGERWFARFRRGDGGHLG